MTEMTQEECRATLARTWRPTPRVNPIAVVLQRPDGAFLVTKVGSGWGLPTAYGHGVRPNYGEPLAKLAQHHHFSLQLNTLMPVGIYPDGHEELNVVTLEVGPGQGLTPSDARWVSLEELAKLHGVSPVVDMALSRLASMRATTVAQSTEVEVAALAPVTVAVPAKPTARKSRRRVQ